MYRKGYTRCPEPSSCNAATSTECSCSVPDEYIDAYGPYKILDDINLISYLESAGILTESSSYDETYYLGLLRVVEDPGIIGEMLSSNAGTYFA